MHQQHRIAGGLDAEFQRVIGQVAGQRQREIRLLHGIAVDIEHRAIAQAQIAPGDDREALRGPQALRVIAQRGAGQAGIGAGAGLVGRGRRFRGRWRRRGVALQRQRGGAGLLAIGADPDVIGPGLRGGDPQGRVQPVGIVVEGILPVRPIDQQHRIAGAVDAEFQIAVARVLGQRQGEIGPLGHPAMPGRRGAGREVDRAARRHRHRLRVLHLRGAVDQRVAVQRRVRAEHGQRLRLGLRLRHRQPLGRGDQRRLAGLLAEGADPDVILARLGALEPQLGVQPVGVVVEGVLPVRPAHQQHRVAGAVHAQLQRGVQRVLGQVQGEIGVRRDMAVAGDLGAIGQIRRPARHHAMVARRQQLPGRIVQKLAIGRRVRAEQDLRRLRDLRRLQHQAADRLQPQRRGAGLGAIGADPDVVFPGRRRGQPEARVQPVGIVVEMPLPIRRADQQHRIAGAVGADLQIVVRQVLRQAQGEIGPERDMPMPGDRGAGVKVDVAPRCQPEAADLAQLLTAVAERLAVQRRIRAGDQLRRRQRQLRQLGQLGQLRDLRR